MFFVIYFNCLNHCLVCIYASGKVLMYVRKIWAYCRPQGLGRRGHFALDDVHYYVYQLELTIRYIKRVFDIRFQKFGLSVRCIVCYACRNICFCGLLFSNRQVPIPI